MSEIKALKEQTEKSRPHSKSILAHQHHQNAVQKERHRRKHDGKPFQRERAACRNQRRNQA